MTMNTKEIAKFLNVTADKLRVELPPEVRAQDDEISALLIEATDEEFDDILLRLNKAALLAVASSLKGSLDEANKRLRARS